ncbi:hypothetical protein Bca52824_081178 [Brassica carinata]|uniref:Uncharacterized protein n=1 Tax=Brassica carinata TaxID=52824 RepID=A0A8X7TR05_BRACI|nr:hypothetical protein Bca52824_081178 [Brassica carinata]
MDSSSSLFGGCGHTCANSGNGYKGEIKRKLYPTRDGRKLVSYRAGGDISLAPVKSKGVPRAGLSSAEGSRIGSCPSDSQIKKSSKPLCMHLRISAAYKFRPG